MSAPTNSGFQARLTVLRWPRLVEISLDPRAPAPERRAAERVLVQRVGELALGESIALARRAPRALFPALRASAEHSVVEALIDNPRALEADAVDVAARSASPVELLRRLAEHPRWGRRHAVRLKLLEHPRTPVALALRFVEELPARDLRRLVDDGKVPRIVRMGARRRLGRFPYAEQIPVDRGSGADVR